MTLCSPLRPLRWSLLALLAAAPAAAHDFWIEPSTFTPAPGARVAVHLRVGEHFAGEPVPRKAERIERFAAVGPGGETAIPGIEETDPAGIASFPAPGIHVLVYDSTHARIELEASKFEPYLLEEGLESIRDLRAKKEQTASPGREIYSRCAKALVQVGEVAEVGTAAESQGYDRKVGLELELIPEKDPTRLAPGTKLPVRLLFRDTPQAGTLVVAFRKDEPKKKLTARTDENGRVELPLDGAGVWLVKAVHMIPASEGANADWASLWASLTFARR